MAQKKKLPNKKSLPKKSARKVKVKAKVHRKKMLVAKPKTLPATKPAVIVAIEAEPKRSTAFAWAGIPVAIMNMWLAPFERRT